MERLPDDRVTIVLHTLGGCVTACVMIANALRQFRESTAVVPYMAISALDFFMGDHAPHEWPIQRPEVEALGIPVALAASTWAEFVDAHRGRIG